MRYLTKGLIAASPKSKSIENDGSNQTLSQGTEPYSDEQTSSTHVNVGPEKKQYNQKMPRKQLLGRGR